MTIPKRKWLRIADDSPPGRSATRPFPDHDAALSAEKHQRMIGGQNGLCASVTTISSQSIGKTHYSGRQLFCEGVVILREHLWLPVKWGKFQLSGGVSHATKLSRNETTNETSTEQADNRSVTLNKNKKWQTSYRQSHSRRSSDPARGRADIPPGGARSRYVPETGRNGGPCSGSSMCPPFPYLPHRGGLRNPRSNLRRSR